MRHRLVVVPISDNVVGYSGGFIMGPDIKTGTQLWRISLGGAVTKLQALPKPASNGPPYEVTAVSPDGKVFAAELGDHTDGCGVGPVSRIFVVNETTGTVSRALMPAGPRSAGAIVRLRPEGHPGCHHGRLHSSQYHAHDGALGVPPGKRRPARRAARSGGRLRPAAFLPTSPGTSSWVGQRLPCWKKSPPGR